MNQSEPSFLNEEISISQLLNVFIENKKIIFIFVFSFVFLGVIYSLSLKNVILLLAKSIYSQLMIATKVVEEF